MNQGETLMNALQDAVPGDVREKLTTAVTGILQTQGTSLNFNGLLDIAKIPDVSSGLKSKIPENVGISSEEGFDKDHHSSDQIERVDELTDSLNDSQPGIDKPTGDLESDPSSGKSQTVNLGPSQSTRGDGVDISGSVRKDTSESGNNDEYDEFPKEKPAPCLDDVENGSETGVKSNFPSQGDEGGGDKEATINEHKDHDGGVAQIEAKEENNNQKTGDSSTDQGEVASSSITEEVPPGSSSEAQAMGNEGNDNQRKDNKSMQPVQDQTNSIMSDPSPTFNVSQALDALTAVDDSTQVAVNSVFGVIENMITQLEEGSEEEDGRKDRNNSQAKKIDSGSDQHSIIEDHKLEEEEENENKQSMQSDSLDDLPVYNHYENSMHSQRDPRTGRVEEDTTQNPNSSNGKSMDRSQGSKTNIHAAKDKNEKKDQLVGSKILADKPAKLRRVNSIPLNITANPYDASLYVEYLRKYLISKKPTKSLDLDTTTALLFDYFPEEGQWKLLEQPGNSGISNSDTTTHYGVVSQVEAHSPAKANDTDNFIEPPYVIFDTEKQQEPLAGYETMDHLNRKVEISDDRLEELMHFVKNIVMDALKVEVGRKLSSDDMKETKLSLARELELVANAVSLAVGHDKEHIRCVEGNHSIQCTPEKLGTLQGELIIRAISSAVQDTIYLRKVLPIGVIIGSSLAALRKSFNVATVHDNSQREVLTHVLAKKSGEKTLGKASVVETDQKPFDKSGHNTNLDTSVSRGEGKDELESSNNNTVMVGAVTAALGASALLVNQQVVVCLF